MNFSSTQFVLSCGLAEQLPESSAAELVFCGRSNVGKSTLINKLCSRKNLARVSQTPGKTATINFFRIDVQYMLVDLPGYGYAKRSFDEINRWAKLMDGYFTSGRTIAAAALLLDSRRDVSADDVAMLNYFAAAKIPFIAVLTKIDKLKKSELTGRIDEITRSLKSYNPLRVAAYTSENQSSVDTLRAELSEVLESLK